MSVTSAPGTPRVGLFLTANILYWFGLYLYVPTLPNHVEARTGSLAAVGIVISMYGLLQALARIPVGLAVDATGRSRPFLIGGFLFAALGAVVLSLGQTAGTLALGRALTGLAAATWVPMVTTFGGFYPQERLVHAASLLTMTGAVGRLLAMFLGGWLNQAVGPGLPFLLAAAAGLLAVVTICLVPLEKRPPRTLSARSFMLLARRREVLAPTLAQTVASFAAWAVTLSFLPIVAGRLGAGDTAKGLLMSLGTATSLLGNSLVAGADRRIGFRMMLRLSFALQCGGIVLAAVSTSLFPIFVAAAVMGVATGLSYPVLMGLSMRGVAVNDRATAAGIHQAIYAIGMFTGPWFGGFVAQRLGIRPMFVITAAITFASAWPLISLVAPPWQRAAAKERLD